MDKDQDIHYMRHAIGLARRGLGRTWPNPSVGCVIVRDGYVVGAARTGDAGRPHAETIAMAQAGFATKGASVYVTLEPCSHHGKTPPCVDALIEAKPARVIIGTRDINPKVNGAGIAALEAAGIPVTVGVMEAECREIAAGFFLRVTENRPLVTLKTACSLDGKVALGNGKSQWITGEIARRHVHQLRAQHDAVLVGIGTVKEDNPMLTARVDGSVRKTVRIVLDSALETPPDSRLVQSARTEHLWIFHEEVSEDKKKALEWTGAWLFQIKGKSLQPILQIIAEQGITRLLVEGGRSIHTAFLKEGFADAFYVYRAPVVLGADAYDAFLDMGHTDLSEINGFVRTETRVLGKDSLEIYARKG